jgi:hypothetical protein
MNTSADCNPGRLVPRGPAERSPTTLRRLPLWTVVTLAGCATAEAQFVENWNHPADSPGWYALAALTHQKQNLLWQPDHGVDNTPFVCWSLDKLAPDPLTGGAFEPLWTFGSTAMDGDLAHPIPNLACTPYVTLAVNASPVVSLVTPAVAAADLGGGRLRFWVGEWNAETNYAFYIFKDAAFQVTAGWIASTIQLNPNEAAWERHGPASGSVPTLGKVLADPQQWGIAIVGGSGPPAGWLGFDDLSIGSAPLSRLPVSWIVPDRFPTIQHAIVSEEVISGDTILVRAGRYAGQISTKRGNPDEFLPACAKRLCIRSFNADAPVLTFQSTVPGHSNHVWLEYGGEIDNLILEGPGLPTVNGIGFSNPTLVHGCVITNYNVGCLAFCAANAIDVPSGVRYNLIAYNNVGVINGDVQHIHVGNIVRNNGLGFDLISGNSAQVLNNVVAFNGRGILVRSYLPVWASYPEIANNTICYNTNTGIMMEWLPPAAPISAVIRDNILACNGGPAIDANTLYGPIACAPNPAGVAGCGLATNQGGCYPQIRNNVFHRNNGATDETDPLYAASNFWYSVVLAQPGGEARYVMHVPNPGGLPGYYGARMIQCLFEDPRFANPVAPWEGAFPWILASNSPCINAGSTTLSLGYGYLSRDGTPVFDKGTLDVGYHPPRLVQPILVATNIADGVVTIRTDQVPKGFDFDILYKPDLSPDQAPFRFEIQVDTRLAPRQGFFWLR